MTINTFDPDERHEVHNARVLELQRGEISGKEFVASLVKQVGFTLNEAKGQWQAMKDEGMIAIYDIAKCRVHVEYPFVIQEQRGSIAAVVEYRRGVISSLYGSGAGAIVSTSLDPFAMRVPFALYDLRLVK